MLHFNNGFAKTIQFQPGNKGAHQGGADIYQTTDAGAQKQIAVQIHPVSVGVTNNLKKFVGEVVQSRPQAPGSQFGHNTEGGRVEGQSQCLHGLQVIIENIGSHSSTLRPSPIGIHINVGSLPGAKGARFKGNDKQEPLLNQQDNQSRKFSALSSASDIFWAKLSIHQEILAQE